MITPPSSPPRNNSSRSSIRASFHHNNHDGSGSSSNETEKNLQKRISELEGLLKRSALQVVQQERLLYRTLNQNYNGSSFRLRPCNLINDNLLDELESKIESVAENEGATTNNNDVGSSSLHRRGFFQKGRFSKKDKEKDKDNASIVANHPNNNYNNNYNMNSGRNSIVNKVTGRNSNKWRPEQALQVAIDSLTTSMAYFESESDLYLTKKAQEMKANKNGNNNGDDDETNAKEELMAQNNDLKQDRDHWKLLYEDCLKQKSAMEDTFKDQIETLEGERDRLTEENQELQGEVLFLQSKDKQRLEDEQEQEQAIVTLHNTIQELEQENTRLQQEATLQLESIAKLQREVRLKKFDARLEDKANDWKVDELQARLQDVAKENSQLKCQVHSQKEQMTELELTHQAQAKRLQKCLQELEVFRIKCQSLEMAVETVSVERSSLRQALLETTEEKEMLLCKCKAQEDAVVLLQQEANEKQKRQQQDRTSNGNSNQATTTAALTQNQILQLKQKIQRHYEQEQQKIHDLYRHQITALEESEERWISKCNSLQTKLAYLQDELERVVMASAVTQQCYLTDSDDSDNDEYNHDEYYNDHQNYYTEENDNEYHSHHYNNNNNNNNHCQTQQQGNNDEQNLPRYFQHQNQEQRQNGNDYHRYQEKEHQEQQQQQDVQGKYFDRSVPYDSGSGEYPHQHNEQEHQGEMEEGYVTPPNVETEEDEYGSASKHQQKSYKEACPRLRQEQNEQQHDGLPSGDASCDGSEYPHHHNRQEMNEQQGTKEGSLSPPKRETQENLEEHPNSLESRPHRFNELDDPKELEEQAQNDPCFSISYDDGEYPHHDNDVHIQQHGFITLPNEENEEEKINVSEYHHDKRAHDFPHPEQQEQQQELKEEKRDDDTFSVASTEVQVD